jgi:hypothetical protein
MDFTEFDQEFIFIDATKNQNIIIFMKMYGNLDNVLF